MVSSTSEEESSATVRIWYFRVDSLNLDDLERPVAGILDSGDEQVESGPDGRVRLSGDRQGISWRKPTF